MKATSGRKPLPKEQKKKAVTIYLTGEEIEKIGGMAAVKITLLDWVKQLTL